MSRNPICSPVLWAVSLMLVLCIAGVSPGAQDKSQAPQATVPGKVTMVDIGAKKCIPCKMMAPILKELEQEYGSTGKAAIIFIDVWENPDSKDFDIRTIPTQIFFDETGKEVHRHEGFMDKGSIIAMLEKLGVK